MTAITIDSKFNECWPKLTPKEKESLLIVAQNYVQSRETSERTNIQQYNTEIEEAMTEIDNGTFYTHEDVVKASKSWLNE